MSTTRELQSRINILEKEIVELRDFKRKIETGQRWLKCFVLFVGSTILTLAALVQIINSWPWPFKK